MDPPYDAIVYGATAALVVMLLATWLTEPGYRLAYIGTMITTTVVGVAIACAAVALWT